MADIWEVSTVRVQGGVLEDNAKLAVALNNYWEPFAVTGVRGDYTYHLRRKTGYPKYDATNAVP